MGGHGAVSLCLAPFRIKPPSPGRTIRLSCAWWKTSEWGQMRLENHLFAHQSLTWADSVPDMAAAAYAGLPGWCELLLTAITGANLPDRTVVFKSPSPFNNPERWQAELSKAIDQLRTRDLGNYRCKTKRASEVALFLASQNYLG